VGGGDTITGGGGGRGAVVTIGGGKGAVVIIGAIVNVGFSSEGISVPIPSSKNGSVMSNSCSNFLAVSESSGGSGGISGGNSLSLANSSLANRSIPSWILS